MYAYVPISYRQMKIFNDKYCHITYSASERAICLKWLQQPNVSVLLNIYTKGIDAAINLKATGWLADNSFGIHLDISMQRALAMLCASRMQETCIKRFARVVPMDVFQELVTHKVANLVNELTRNKIEIEVFSDLLDAKAWVAQQNIPLASVS